MCGAVGQVHAGGMYGKEDRDRSARLAATKGFVWWERQNSNIWKGTERSLDPEGHDWYACHHIRPREVDRRENPEWLISFAKWKPLPSAWLGFQHRLEARLSHAFLWLLICVYWFLFLHFVLCFCDGILRDGRSSGKRWAFEVGRIQQIGVWALLCNLKALRHWTNLLWRSETEVLKWGK